MKHFLFSFIFLTASFAFGADPFDGIFRDFAQDVTFCADFDAPEALIAAGSEKPLSVSEDAQFGDGLSGRCLTKGKVVFDGAENISPTTGSIIFWMKLTRPTETPDTKEESFRPIYAGFQAETRQEILIGKMDVLNQAPMYAYLQGHPEIPLVLVNSGKTTKTWKSGVWHLVIVSWKPGELKISLDGQPFAANTKLPALGGEAKEISIRATDHPLCAVAVDQVIVLKRPVTDEEVAKIAREIPTF